MPNSSKKRHTIPKPLDAAPPLRVPLTAEQRAALANHPEPSAASLREIPPLNLETAKFFPRGPEGLRQAMEYMRAKRGRPKKGEVAAGSSPRSLRLSDAEWAAVDQLAQRLHTTPHALLQKAVRRELAEGAAPAQAPAKSRKRKVG